MKLAYLAYDRAGKKVRDVIEAGSTAEAGDVLRRRGLYVTEMKPSAEGGAAPKSGGSRGGSSAKGGGSGGDAPIKIGRGRRMKCLMMFTRQLYVLVSTGTPLVESLVAIERQTRDPLWTRVLTRLRTKLEEGASLAEAMGDQPLCFDAVTRSLVAAGESSGKLPVMLDRVAQLTRKQVHVRSSVIGAMVYPALLLVVAVSVLCMMLMFVLPRFGGMFQTMGMPLPPTTQALMVISTFMIAYWWALGGGLVGGGVGLKLWTGTAGGKRAMQTMSIRVPQFGKITRNFITARMVRLMGILLDSYLPLLDVLALVRESITNAHYRALLDRAEEAVTRGEPISTAFNDPKLISPSVYEAIRSGEQSGQIGSLLLNIAEFLDEDNDVVVRSLTSIIEPIILIVLGGLVGLVAVSMFMPLFDLTSMMGKG